MKLNKIEPKFIKKNNPRIGLITLASDFRIEKDFNDIIYGCLLYTSPSPRDQRGSRMPSSA